MRLVRTALTVILPLTMLSGCASQLAQDNLSRAKYECSMGNRYACDDIPNVSRVVDDQIRASTALIVAIPLAILLGGR